MTTPDPLETVTLLKSDFELLQRVADFAVEDTVQIAAHLGIEMPENIPPRQVLYETLLPKIDKLMVTQGFVNASTEQIKSAAARFGNQTISQGGKKGLLVGKKIPGLLDGPRG